MLFRLQKKTPPPLTGNLVLYSYTVPEKISSVVCLLEVAAAALRNLCLSPFWYLSWGSSQDTKSYPYLFIFPLFPTQIESSFRDWGLMNLCVSNYQHNVWHMEVFTYFSSELMKTTTYQLIKTSSHSV